MKRSNSFQKKQRRAMALQVAAVTPVRAPTRPKAYGGKKRGK